MTSPAQSIGAIIQARMSSQRLPGKVLLPLAGKAILEHVFTAVASAVGAESTMIATSTDPSDDPIVRFCEDRGFPYFRGPLQDVFSRFQEALKTRSWSGFFRVCADSPFYSADLMKRAHSIFEVESPDLVTNVFPRSFPKGMSVELFRREPFLALSAERLNAEEREHVSPYYYRHLEAYRIRNFSAPVASSEVNLCIDTSDDYRRAQRYLAEHPAPRLYEICTKELLAGFGEGSRE